MLQQKINKIERNKESMNEPIYMDLDEFLKGQNIDSNITDDETRKDDDNE